MKERIGEYFVRLDLLSLEQAEEILRVQETKEPRKKFGEIALELGYITDDDLEEALPGESFSPPAATE